MLVGSFRQWCECVWSRRLQTRDALHRLLVARLAHETKRSRRLEESLEAERLQAQHVRSEHRFQKNSLIQEVKELRSEISWSERRVRQEVKAGRVLSPGDE